MYTEAPRRPVQVRSSNPRSTTSHWRRKSTGLSSTLRPQIWLSSVGVLVYTPCTLLYSLLAKYRLLMPNESVVSMFRPPIQTTNTSHPITTSGTKQHVSLYIMSPEDPSAQYSGYVTLKLTLNGRPTINWLSYSFRVRLLITDCSLHRRSRNVLVRKDWQRRRDGKNPSESSQSPVRAFPFIH